MIEETSHKNRRIPCFICHNTSTNLNGIPLCDNCSKKYQDTYDPEIPSTNSTFQQINLRPTRPNKLHRFFSKRLKKEFHVRQYYHSLNDWIDIMDQLHDIQQSNESTNDSDEINFTVRFSTYCSFCLNFLLLLSKAFAMSTSSSYTIMSSLADSCLDIIAGIIISYTASISNTTENDKYEYPIGKSRISTVGILIFSVLMSCCAIFMIMECAQSLIRHEHSPPTTATAIRIMMMTIVIKFFMWIVYSWLNHPITLTLAEDHRNDVFTNSFGLFMYWGGEHFYWWMDSIGGLSLSLFVLFSWIKNAIDNGKMLIGITANPDLIRKLTYLSMQHHKLIKSVSNITAYQIGPKYFAEVTIVVDNKVSSEVTCYLMRSLMRKLEQLDEIEHGYVIADTANHDENLQYYMSISNY